MEPYTSSHGSLLHGQPENVCLPLPVYGKKLILLWMTSCPASLLLSAGIMVVITRQFTSRHHILICSIFIYSKTKGNNFTISLAHSHIICIHCRIFPCLTNTLLILDSFMLSIQGKLCLFFDSTSEFWKQLFNQVGSANLEKNINWLKNAMKGNSVFLYLVLDFVFMLNVFY